MANARIQSPPYPAHPIGDVLRRLGPLSAVIEREPVERSVLLGALGYKTANGSAKRMLSSFRQYRLITRVDDSYSLGSLALRILEVPSDVEARSTAAWAPLVYRSIRSNFGDATFSDAEGTDLLAKLGYASEAARRILANYRQLCAEPDLKVPSDLTAPSETIAVQSGPDRNAASGRTLYAFEFEAGASVMILQTGEPDPAEVVDLIEDWARSKRRILATERAGSGPA